MRQSGKSVKAAMAGVHHHQKQEIVGVDQVDLELCVSLLRTHIWTSNLPAEHPAEMCPKCMEPSPKYIASRSPHFEHVCAVSCRQGKAPGIHGKQIKLAATTHHLEFAMSLT